MSAEALDTGGAWHAGARWSSAAIIVLVAHMAGAWIITQQQEASTGKAPEAIMIELASLPMTSSAAAIDAAPAPQISEVQPEPVNEAAEPEIEIPPPPEPVEPTFDTAESQPPPTVPEPEVALPEPPPKKQPVAEPPKPEVKRKPALRAPRHEKQSKPHSRVATAPSRAQAAAAVSAAPALGSTVAPSTSPADWRGALITHLNRAKRYPPEARQQREEGTVRLSFTIDRSGRVERYQIVGSSGSAALDREAVAMIQRASPLPAPPPGIGGARISLTVPLHFNIN